MPVMRITRVRRNFPAENFCRNISAEKLCRLIRDEQQNYRPHFVCYCHTSKQTFFLIWSRGLFFRVQGTYTGLTKRRPPHNLRPRISVRESPSLFDRFRSINQPANRREVIYIKSHELRMTHSTNRGAITRRSRGTHTHTHTCELRRQETRGERVRQTTQTKGDCSCVFCALCVAFSVRASLSP